jgi:signal peptidase I
MKLKKRYVWLLGVIVLLVAGIFYLRLYYRQFIFSSSAMYPTIKEGSRLLVDMKAYKSKSPELYDVVVFNLGSPVLAVCRVIGLPKDQISYSSDGRLLINGQPLASPPKLSIAWKKPPVKAQVHINTPYTVPSDSYFLVEDAVGSIDGKYFYDSKDFGAVPKKNIRGKVVYIFPPESPPKR